MEYIGDKFGRYVLEGLIINYHLYYNCLFLMIKKGVREWDYYVKRCTGEKKAKASENTNWKHYFDQSHHSYPRCTLKMESITKLFPLCGLMLYSTYE